MTVELDPHTDRIVNDQYFTDPLVASAIVRRMITVWKAISPIRQMPHRILEPSVGMGAFAAACRELLADTHIVGVDIDAAMQSHAGRHLDKFIHADFVQTHTKNLFDLAIGNPPFTDAEEHYHHAMSLVKDGGCVCFLLKYSFKGGVGRNERIWRKEVRNYCYDAAIVPRPSFAFGATDKAQEYAAFMWFKGIKDKLSNTGAPIVWR